MPSVPLPFLVALLLLVLFVSVLRRDSDTWPNLPFLLLILMSALQSVLLGLRWGYHVEAAAYLLPIVATTVPPLVYAGTTQVLQARAGITLRQGVLFALPAIVVIALTILWREAIDLTVVFVFTAYAVASLRLLWSGVDSLGYTSFEEAASVFRAIVFGALALLLSAVLDTAIYLDFLFDGAHDVGSVLAVGDVLVLVILGVAAAAASKGKTDAAPEDGPAGAEPEAEPAGGPAASPAAGPVTGMADRPEAEPPSGAEIDAAMARVTELMRGRHLYRDANLNLDRIARKALIPARQISQAVNLSTGQNVSQFVNGFRIAEACDLLETTTLPITEIMFRVGFQTKSNFNREFRRITERTPKDWRTERGII